MFNMARETFHGLGVQDIAVLILIEALSSAYWENERKFFLKRRKKQKRKKVKRCGRGFFPRAGTRHDMLTVPGRIFRLLGAIKG
jgi:hypothetical protein